MVNKIITGKKKLSEFRGILSKDSAEEYEREIKNGRRERNKLHRRRVKAT
jgi:hypothetical protein